MHSTGRVGPPPLPCPSEDTKNPAGGSSGGYGKCSSVLQAAARRPFRVPTRRPKADGVMDAARCAGERSPAPHGEVSAGALRLSM